MVLSSVRSAVMVRLIRIGYWSSPDAPDLPDLSRFVDPTWDSDDRETIADYVRRGIVARAYLGKSICRICGQAVGSLELSDGVYVWPEGLAHYIDAHEVRLPPRFVDHVHERTAALEDAEVDDAWWRGEVKE